MGELGLLPAEFYDMTWSQYQRAALGRQIREDKEWQRTRLIVWGTIQPHTKKHISPRDFYESIFDKGAVPVTEDEYELACKAWKLN